MKAIRQLDRPVMSKNLMAAKFRKSPVLDRLLPEREKHWLPILKRRRLKNMPSVTLKNFSFLDDPAGALASLRKVGQLEGEATEAALHFDDDFCLDAGAYLVLAEIWPQMARIFSGGRMTRPVQKVLSAIGVGRHNKMTLPAVAEDPEFLMNGKHTDVWAFPLQRRRPAGTSTSSGVHIEPQTRERATDRFCETVNDWLGIPEIERELTQEGKGWIAGIIGELLCNAERHSQAGSVDGDWSVTAFMVKRSENGTDVFRCYMAFLSVGRSFAEGLSDAAPDVRTFVDNYIAGHWRSRQSPATLATLVALQDTVTRDPKARSMGSGGTGLMDVLDLVSLLGPTEEPGKEARVTIVSGNSCIKLRAPYITGDRREGPTAPRVLWCNAENSPEYPPDDGVVFDLEEHFAGTLVSVAFTLDPVYFADESEAENDSD
ncbi:MULTISPECIES: hypothetical protein [unclassified Sphingobium]|uniref:hypothetical protein n=1 Tax=unclassified Sphingobium TaxID=2611147 RepID=UPI0012905226|nr:MULTISPECIES: hypothetical protein [unclassified Sphingobium]